MRVLSPDAGLDSEGRKFFEDTVERLLQISDGGVFLKSNSIFHEFIRENAKS